MANMEVILTEEVANLGESGEIVKVKAGYGRNYLIPKGIAIKATSKNKARLEHEQRVIELKRAKQIKTAEDLKEKLEDITITIPKKVGENEKLYGSVTKKEIVDALAKNNLQIEKRQLELNKPIKEIGVQNIDIKLTQGITAKLKVWIVSEE